MSVIPSSLGYRSDLWALKLSREEDYGIVPGNVHASSEDLGLVERFTPPELRNTLKLQQGIRPSTYFPSPGNYFPFANIASNRSWTMAYENSNVFQGSIESILTNPKILSYVLGDITYTNYEEETNIKESLLVPSFTMEGTYYQQSGNNALSLWTRYKGCKISQCIIRADEGKPLRFSADIIAQDAEHNISEVAAVANERTWLGYSSALDSVQTDNPLEMAFNQDVYLFSGGHLEIYEPDGNNQPIGPTTNSTWGRLAGFELVIDNGLQPQYYIQNVDAYGRPNISDLIEGERRYRLTLRLHPDDQDIYRLLEQQGYYGGERRGYGIRLRFDRPLMGNFEGSDYLEIRMPASTQITNRGWSTTPFSYPNVGPIAGPSANDPVQGCYMAEAPHIRDINEPIINAAAVFEVPSVEIYVRRRVIVPTPVFGPEPPPEGIPFWIAYGDDATEIMIRRGRISAATGLWTGWDTAAIGTGYTASSTAYATAIKAHPTDVDLVYVAFTDEVAKRITLARWTGTGASTTQVDERTWTQTPWMQIKDIFVENADPNSVWFVATDHTTTGGTEAATLRGVYHAADGVTFSKVHNGGLYQFSADGPAGIYVNTTAPRRIWIGKKGDATPTVGTAAFSDNEGATWTEQMVDSERGDINWLQGYPYETDTRLYLHSQRNIFLGLQQVLSFWRRVDSTWRLPIYESNGYANAGGLLGTNEFILLRARSDFTDGQGTKADVTGAGAWSLVQFGNNDDHIPQPGGWWNGGFPIQTALEIRCFATSYQQNLFLVANDRQQTRLRGTVDGGVTWTNIDLPGVPHAVAIPALV